MARDENKLEEAGPLIAPATSILPGKVPTNLQLLMRMARFLVPVRQTALIACILVAIWVLLDVNAIRLTGEVTNGVKNALDEGQLTQEPFLAALRHPPLEPIARLIGFLGIL